MVAFSAPPDADVEYVGAAPDSINTGVLDDDGAPHLTPYNMYVDDNLYADIPSRMPRAIAASIRSLFDIQGHPHPDRRIALSTKKLTAAPASYTRVDLGFLINTRTMMVSLPPAKLADAVTLLTSFTLPRRSVSLREVARLVGTLTHMCTICHWGRYHFNALTHSIKVALRCNDAHLRLQPQFTHWVRLIAERSRAGPPTSGDLASYFRTKQARALWNCPLKVFITTEMRHDVDRLHEVLSDPSQYPWQSPISHMIPRDPSFTAYGDASLMAGGGYSSDLHFWWHLEWPSEIHHRTIKFWDDNKERLVSINLLEFIVVILNYAASLLAIRTSPPPHDPYPVL